MKKNDQEAMSRKSFLRNTALAATGMTLAAACGTDQTQAEGPAVISNKRYRWNMVTTWPPNFPVVGEGCNLFAQWVDEMSKGQLTIRVFGGGELIPALESFDAVSSATAEIGSGAAYYWAGKSPATQFFGAIPFGLNSQQAYAWLIGAGGMELWKELYAEFNLVPFVGGTTGVQMGGWFNREINEISDVKGLKMRIPGLGGKVLERAGGAPVLSAGSEIYTNLERGVIDATEWIGPYHDYLMGFHEIAQYYYYPGWHEPCAVLELFVNKRKYEQLPAHLKRILEAASHTLHSWMLAEFEAKNGKYLEKIVTEADVEVRAFPDELIQHLKGIAVDVTAEVAGTSALAQRIYDSYTAFIERNRRWANISEHQFYSRLI